MRQDLCAYYQVSRFLQIRSYPTLGILDLIYWISCSRHSYLNFIKGTYYNNLEEVPGRCLLSSTKFLCVLIYGSWRNFLSGFHTCLEEAISSTIHRKDPSCFRIYLVELVLVSLATLRGGSLLPYVREADP